MWRIKLVCLFILGSVSCYSQDYQPIELAKKLFTTDFPNVQNYIKGEFKGRPNKNDLAKGVNTKFKTLTLDHKNAVVNVTVTDSLGKGVDAYLHFERENVWKITALRGLAMTGLYFQMLEDYDKMSDDDINQLIISNKNNIDSFRSKEEFLTLMNNIRLTVALDDDIVKHFKDNQSKFYALKTEIQKYKNTNPKATSKEITAHFKKQIQNLYLTSYGCLDLEWLCEECFSFTIGGMVDNMVGYFYLPNGVKLPKTNPSRLIMIREIGEGWYMFKTT
ncbi:MAG: hypothetical protein CSA38_02085 [Flavobacteriales bacterium]|nr:MAG: hypothetical protein CSA38_02085 [Flavobacteriales bacterium]